jgi:transaldolase/glucose-6-phosphate isomerase
MNLKVLHALGQSIWLDYLSRDLILSGRLAELIGEDGLRGITSNPSIFAKAIEGSTHYDDAIARMANQTPGEIFEQLAIEDIRAAADLLRPVFDDAERNDGFVSLEVSPVLAHDTARTIEEAHRLWSRVDRENVMIKVPATHEGIPAIRQLLADGININVTLMFSRDVYAQVAEAHIEGLEDFVARGGDLRRIASVASFFVSRIDTAIDKLLESRHVGDEIVGKVAIANARLAYQDYKARLHAPRWQALAIQGARPQRPLWASTSTKDPKLPDLYYVEALVGPDTVDTVPMQTLEALLYHGQGRLTLEMNLDEAHTVLAALPRYGIALSHVTDKLLDDGIALFTAAYEQLLVAVDAKRRRIAQPEAAW